MKTLLILVLAVAALMAGGCASKGSAVSLGMINQVLDASLPPAFTGAIRLKHRNPYVTLAIEADGLKRGPNGWQWTWLTYQREGRVSNGIVIFGKPPQRTVNVD